MNLNPNYFAPHSYKHIKSDDINRSNKNILEVVNTHYNLSTSSDKEKAQQFWSLLIHYYKNVRKKITRLNSRNYNFLNFSKEEKLQKKYLNDLMPNLDILDESFSKMTGHLNALFTKKCRMDTGLKFDYYYDAHDDSHIPSIGLVDNRVIVIINRNIDILFHKDVQKFDAIFLHEAAHIHQNDTKYFFKKQHFLSSGFLLKGVFNFLILIIPLIGIYAFIYFYMFPSFEPENPSVIDMRIMENTNRILGRQFISKSLLYMIPIIVMVILYRLNIRKKNRLLVEYGADLFGLVVARNTSIIDAINFLPNEKGSKKNIHSTAHERKLDLLSVMSYAHLIIKN